MALHARENRCFPISKHCGAVHATQRQKLGHKAGPNHHVPNNAKMMLTYLELEVQGLRGDKISPHKLERCSKLLLELFTAHDLGSLGYLSKKFF